MKPVVIVSPWRATDVFSNEQHSAYLNLCLADSLSRDEAPFAPHAIYPRVLNDEDYADRLQGILAGLVWAKNAALVACYNDFGVSEGMTAELTYFRKLGIPIERRIVDDMEAVMAIKNG